MSKLLISVILVFGMTLAGCGRSNSGAPPLPPPPPTPPVAPVVNIQADIKQLVFSWADVSGATHYRLFNNPDGHSGFTQTGADIPAGTLSITKTIAVHLYDWANALYMVQACNSSGCTGSTEVSATNIMLDTIGYFKASNSGGDLEFGRGLYLLGDRFGVSVAIDADGTTMAVGAHYEDSSATGIDGNQNDNSAFTSGAVYLFRYDSNNWVQQAYIKASNTNGCEHVTGCPGDNEPEFGDNFGKTAVLSADGNMLVVGAPNEDSSATGINGNQTDNSYNESGAAYVFRFDGANWYQQAYVKASDGGGYFGAGVDVSADGNTLAVGAWSADAAYIFRFDGISWSEQARVTASNADFRDGFSRVELSADGNTLVVGAPEEDSNAAGIDGDQADNTAINSGAVYVFRFDGTMWSQQAYIKASNPGTGISGSGDSFGEAVALGPNGDTLAVGARLESSSATGINGDQSDNSARSSGAVYLFRFDGSEWFQQAYIKASDTESGRVFGSDVELTEDASKLVVNGRPAYIFGFDGENWSELSNAIWPELTELSCPLGGTIIAVSSDGQTLAGGSPREGSDAISIGSAREYCQTNQYDRTAIESGAVFLY